MSSRRRYSYAQHPNLSIANNLKKIDEIISRNEMPEARIEEKEKQVKKKQRRISFLTMIVGKPISLLRKTRKTLAYRNLENLTPLQMELMGDAAVFPSQIEKMKMASHKRAHYLRMKTRLRVKELLFWDTGFN